MTKEEFLLSQESIKKEIENLSALQSRKLSHLHQLRKDWCNELCKQYADFIGKRVKIVFNRKDTKTEIITRVEGFLIGFSYQKDWGTDGIKPDIAKVKNDGTASKVLMPNWKLCYWDEIESIEKI